MNFMKRLKQQIKSNNVYIKELENLKDIDNNNFKYILNLLRKIKILLKQNKNLLKECYISDLEANNIKKIFIEKYRDKYWIVDEYRLNKMRYDLYALDRYSSKVIGFEIKVNKYDLLNDNKFENYLNNANVLYFVIPEFLKDIAITKINNSKLKKHIGIITINKTFEIKYIKKPISNKKEFNIEQIEKNIKEKAYFRYVYNIFK